ncbi:hypothetical protein ALC57_07260 [Trachymyrmex cornetzi]|uniref:Uncharacterized protein n=1 Tax=Trachymyrmex cornetzi TaxID=471704 RepID=A0A195E5J5_9HYME|nr:hypothetical protein ALC57_07260 [Trachymyrmex cornetzi]
MQLGSFDAFLFETKESVRKNVRSAPRAKILSVKVDDYKDKSTKLAYIHKQNYPIAFPLLKSHVKCDWIIFFMYMFMRAMQVCGYILVAVPLLGCSTMCFLSLFVSCLFNQEDKRRTARKRKQKAHCRTPSKVRKSVILTRCSAIGRYP